uniref:MarR family transcriptional regulator n=1 Tax=Jeotgalibaca porci TaxID=1868793 RepID=UPI0035A004E6
MIANKMTLREHNETLVLSTIIHNPEISRAAISQLTGLNKASTSEIVKKFSDEQLINEIGIGNSTTCGGRKPIQLQINYDVGCSLSIDIGYEYIYG